MKTDPFEDELRRLYHGMRKGESSNVLGAGRVAHAAQVAASDHGHTVFPMALRWAALAAVLVVVCAGAALFHTSHPQSARKTVEREQGSFPSEWRTSTDNLLTYSGELFFGSTFATSTDAWFDAGSILSQTTNGKDTL